MTRRLRMILTMILAVMLCVVFSIPSLAFEADNLLQETVPAEETMTTPAPEPTVTVSPPVEIAVIEDEDWGNVGPEKLDVTVTPAAAEETLSGGETEPEAPDLQEDLLAEEETAAEPAAAEPETAPEEELPAADQQQETEPAAENTVEEPAAENTAEEPAGKIAEEQPIPDAAEPADLPDADESGEGSSDEANPEEEETAEPESEPETEKARVTVKVEISMIDETVMRLLAVVDDPEGREFLYQWQVSEDSGMTYTDIPEATTDELKVELTDENISDMWRVRVQAI